MSHIAYYCRTSELELEDFSALHNSVRRGDIVGIKGYPGWSNTGEFSIYAQEVVVLTPCLHMPPSLKTGLTDKVETCHYEPSVVHAS